MPAVFHPSAREADADWVPGFVSTEEEREEQEEEESSF